MNAVACFSCLVVAPVLIALDKGQYDPLKVPEQQSAKSDPIYFEIEDSKRSREIPIRVFLPAKRSPAPVILFSHGLGGSRDNNTFMATHWSARGYVVVNIQHPGSDESVWKKTKLTERMAALNGAANLQNYLARVNDIPAVLDQLERWNKTSKHILSGRLDLQKVGMSGHSFGAITTQAVSGQTQMRGNVSFTERRIKAALAFSPSAPKVGDPKRAFGDVKIPWMLMTGTEDKSIIGGSTLEDRYAVYPALPPGSKYELVLKGAQHSAFSERPLPGDKGKRNPNHHKVILALGTAFWDAYLRNDAAAKSWLDGDGPLSVLEKEDRWQKK